MKHPNSITEWKRELSKMTQIQLAELRRFAPASHIVFTDDRLTEYFNACFKAKGGLTAEVSKAIGWEPR